MKIQDYISFYEKETVQISPSVSYNQRDIVDKNHQMRNGQFEDNYFSDGKTEKYYFNVIMGFAQTLKKGSKLRVKDFLVSSLDGKFPKLVKILEGALKHYLKFSGFIETKEDVQEELIEMGHVVTKIVDGETYTVDLRNLVYKPNSKSLKEDGCAEKLYFSYEEAKGRYGDNKNWNEIKEHYEKIKDTESELTFIEYWTVDEFEVKGKKEITKGCIVYLDRSETKPDEKQNPDEWETHLEIERYASPNEIPVRNKREKKIYGDTRRIFPYDEERLITLPGRYLGMGVYEMCRPAQEDYNEKRNIKRKFDRLALRGILVHKIGNMRQESDGEALTQEFLKRLDTGGALKIFNDESLERLNIGSTTSDTLAMLNDLFEFMRFLLGVTPIAVGQTSTNKTASFAVIQNQTQQDTYQVIKNKTARLFERIFTDFLLEDVIEDILSGDTIAIYADKEDLKEMDKFLATNAVNKDFTQARSIAGKDKYNEEIKNRMVDLEQFGESRFIDMSDDKVKKAFRKLLEDIKYIIEFNVTDESIDPNVKIKTLLDADKIENARIRDRVVELVGLNPKELQETEEEQQAKMAQQVAQERAMTEARNIPEQPIMPNV